MSRRFFSFLTATATVVGAAIALTPTNAAANANWNGFRGPNRDDHSPDTGLLKKWPEDGPKRVWMFENAGIGYSGFAIVDGKIYTMGAREDMEQLIVLDAATGKELYHVEIGPVYTNKWGDGPRSTPTVDGGLVYALGAKGTLACIDTLTKKIVWKADYEDDFGGELPGWGFCESVLVDGDQLICTPGGKKGAMVALNKKTGKKIWQSEEMAENTWYASPVVTTIHGKRQYVNVVHNNLFAADAKDGKVLWSTPWRGTVAVIPTVITHGDSVYISSGYNAGCKKVTIKSDWTVTTDYDLEKGGIVNHHGGVILVDGHLYGHSDSGGWTCQKFDSGEVVWQDKGVGKGAVGYADGMLYCLAEGSGKVALVPASAAGYSEVSSFKLDPQTKLRKPDGRIWVHPTIIGGRLYLRDQDLIYCYNVKG